MSDHLENLTKAAQSMEQAAKDLQAAHASTGTPAEEILLLDYLERARNIHRALDRLARGV